MAWIQDGVKAGIISVITAFVIYLWKKAKPISREIIRIIKCPDLVEKLEKEVAVLKKEVSVLRSKQMAGFHTDPVPTFICNTKGELIYANPAWVKLTGYSNPENAYGFRFFDVIYHEDLLRIQKISEELIGHPAPYEGLVRLVNKITKEVIQTFCTSELIYSDEQHKELIETIGRLQIL